MRQAVGLLLVCIVMPAGAQTSIDLSTQAKNVNFTKASSTRPIKTVIALPPVCTLGELIFLQGPSDVIYACIATNVWVLQSGSNAQGIGLLAQTESGSVTRTLVGGTGLILGNADGIFGNPSIAVDIATPLEARNGVATNKLLTPDGARQAFTDWNSFPAQASKNYGFLMTNGTTPIWTWQLITPASGTQLLTTNQATIAADRQFVRVEPLTGLALNATPIVADGLDGQFLTIANVSRTNTVTLPDEAVTAGSNLRLGGRSVGLGPMQSITLVFVSALGDWVSTQAGDVSGAKVAGPAFAIDGQLAVFDGVSGKLVKTSSITGVLKTSNGVPSAVTGNASDCVKVDGTSGVCTSASSETVAAGSGITITGSPIRLIASKFATSLEAVNPLVTDRVMSPEAVSLAISNSSPVPSQSGKSGSMLMTNGATMAWSWTQAFPSSNTQVVSAGTPIVADRSFVKIDAASTFTFTVNPVIADATDGQKLTIVNVSSTNTITLPDEAIAPGSNIRLGGSNLALGPLKGVSLIFVASLSTWVIDGGVSSSAPASLKEINFVLGSGADLLVGDSISVPRLITTASAGTLTKLYAKAGTGPTGSPVTIQLKVNGVAITTVSIAAGSTLGTTTTFSSPTLAENDVLTVAVTGVGSVIAGRDVHLVAVVK